MDKICTKCAVPKSFSEYCKDKYKKSGLTSQCSKCRYQKKVSNFLQVKQSNKRQRIKNKETIELKRNSEEGKKYSQEYRKANKAKAAVYRNKYRSNPINRLAHNVRVRVREILSQHKSKKSFELVGCSLENLKQQLESQFQPGMTWQNYGKWHIDHIVPLSSGNNIQAIEHLCHYTNLQPLWAEQNLKKGKKAA